MKFVKVDKIPEPKTKYGQSEIARYLEGFAISDAKIVRVDFTERDYSNQACAVNNIRRAIARRHYGMLVHFIGANIYIEKTY